MEMTSNEDVQKSKSSSNEADHHHDYHEDMVPDVLNHGYITSLFAYVICYWIYSVYTLL